MNVPAVYYLELHIAQVKNELSLLIEKKERGLFNNRRVIEYINTLNDVIDHLQKSDLPNCSDNDKLLRQNILIYISTCIQYLKSATTEDLNPTLYVCLRAALEDWVKQASSNYVITSYKADIGSHHYSPLTILSQAIKSIQDIWGIVIPYRLVSLGYPSHLEKDFISNVSLYHELGHFIDLCEWKISVNIVGYILFSKRLPLPSEYFKNIDEKAIFDFKNSSQKIYQNMLLNLIQEYFADIFAAQYIGRHKNHLVNYMAGDNDFSSSHPSTKARARAIDNFLLPEYQHDEFINLVKNVTLRITGKELKIRSTQLTEANLLAGQAYDNLQKEQLHSLFHNAWEIWEYNKANFKNSPNYLDAYDRLNRLLNQSIINYERRNATP